LFGEKARKEYVRRIIIFCVIMFALRQFSFADTVRLKSGEEKTGVILRSDPETIFIALEGGDEEIDVKDVENVVLSDEEDNLMFLADRALSAGDITTAYYLYTKVFWSDPDNERAIKGIARLDPAMLIDINVRGWVGGYERYQTQPRGSTDREILSGNSEQTGELLKNIGLILKAESGRIKVTEAVKGSRGWKGGVRINDFLTKIDGRPISYMGVFDAVTVMLKRGEKAINIEVEREVKQWVSGEGNSVQVFISKDDNALIFGKEVFVITGGKDIPFSSEEGARTGDILVSLNGVVPETGISPEGIRDLFRRSAGNNVSMIVRRKMSI
jgi:hypothetical protein